jgi:hypothetical protein
MINSRYKESKIRKIKKVQKQNNSIPSIPSTPSIASIPSKNCHFNNLDPILYFIYSKKCGSCNIFNSNGGHDRLMEMLEKDNIVSPKVIYFPELVAVLDNKHHPKLNSVIKWFPSFILVSRNCCLDFKTNLKSVVIGATYSENGDIDITKGSFVKNEADDIYKEILVQLRDKFSDEIPFEKVSNLILEKNNIEKDVPGINFGNLDAYSKDRIFSFRSVNKYGNSYNKPIVFMPFSIKENASERYSIEDSDSF